MHRPFAVQAHPRAPLEALLRSPACTSQSMGLGTPYRFWGGLPRSSDGVNMSRCFASQQRKSTEGLRRTSPDIVAWLGSSSVLVSSALTTAVVHNCWTDFCRTTHALRTRKCGNCSQGIARDARHRTGPPIRASVSVSGLQLGFQQACAALGLLSGISLDMFRST